MTTIAVFLGIAVLHNVVVAVALAVEGFVLLASLPIALEWSQQHAGPQRAGTATGFLLLAGNVGGVVLVLLVEVFIGNAYAALVVMAAVAVPGLLFTRRLPRRVDAAPAESAA